MNRQPVNAIARYTKEMSAPEGNTAVRPLYKDARDVRVSLAQGNAGLIWERFFNGYDDAFALPTGKDSGKGRFIDLFSGKQVGNESALRMTAKRMRDLAQALGGRAFSAKNDWHFATGLGAAHPTENSLTFHRTLGVPYLPGSSVKGLLRGFLEWSGQRDCLKLWFGSDRKGANDTEAGSLIFLDALPLSPVVLAADVVTPHYGSWYESGDKVTAVDPEIVPADWHTPVPSGFLVAKEARLQFAVAPRAGGLADTHELDVAIDLLQEALAEMGAGAKTAAGYGRFYSEQEQ